MQKEKLDLILYVVFTTLFVLLLVVAAVMLFRIYFKRKNALLKEKEKMSIEFEKTLLSSKLEIQEQTFTHIGQEIHDNIGQVLSLVKINLNTLNAPKDEQKINLMDTLMEKAIADLRNLSHSLDTDIIRSIGWLKAAEKIFLDLQKTKTHNVTIQTEENLPVISNEKSIILYRMIQEVVNNIIRHAFAKEIKFSAVMRDRNIIISIKDNGNGFDISAANGGAGLQNLRNRAKMISAAIGIHSGFSQGTLVTISVNI